MTDTASVIRVMLVEDHHIFLNALAEAMSLNERIEVVGSFSEPEDAVARAGEAAIDVLVTDLEWRADPERGIKLIHEVLALSPATKVLVCSAHDDGEMIRRAIQAGAGGYMIKDEVTAVDVVEAVTLLVADKPAFSETVIQAIATLLREASEGAPAVHPLDTLTRRERTVLPLLIDGLSNARIAKRLGVSEKTVKTHVSNVLQKLGLSSRHQVAGYVRGQRRRR